MATSRPRSLAWPRELATFLSARCDVLAESGTGNGKYSKQAFREVCKAYTTRQTMATVPYGSQIFTSWTRNVYIALPVLRVSVLNEVCAFSVKWLSSIHRSLIIKHYWAVQLRQSRTLFGLHSASVQMQQRTQIQDPENAHPLTKGTNLIIASNTSVTKGNTEGMLT